MQSWLVVVAMTVLAAFVPTQSFAQQPPIQRPRIPQLEPQHIEGPDPLNDVDDLAPAPNKKPSVLVEMKVIKLTGQEDDLRELQIERFNAGVLGANSALQLYRGGQCELRMVLEANRKAIVAAIDMSTSLDERLTWRRRYVEVAKELEHACKVKAERGAGTQFDLYDATYDRAEAEIELLRLEREIAKAAPMPIKRSPARGTRSPSSN